MTRFYVGALAAGSGNGSSRANKAVWTNLNTVLSIMSPGDEVAFVAEDTYAAYTGGAAAVVLSHAGSAGNPLKVTSVNLDGSYCTPTQVPFLSSNRDPGSAFTAVGGATAVAGSPVFRFDAGAAYLTVERLGFQNLGIAFQNTAGITADHLLVQHHRAVNIRQFFRNNGSVTNLEVGHVQVLGHSKQLFHIVGNGQSSDLWFHDIYADCQNQDGDNAPTTIAIVGNAANVASHRVLIERVTGKNCVYSQGGDPLQYWEGDGCTTEEFDLDIVIRNSRFTGMGDAGLDLKSGKTVVYGCTFDDNKCNVRQHAGSVGANTLVQRSHFGVTNIRGGTGTASQIQANGRIWALDCTFVDTNPAARVLNAQSAAGQHGDIAVVGGSISYDAASDLTHTDDGNCLANVSASTTVTAT